MPNGLAGREPAGVLVERDRDLAIVEEAVAEAARGRSAVVAIEGPAGIGKTRLLTEARRFAQGAGVRVLAARASELEGELAFGVVRQLFEGAFDAGGVEPLGSGAAAAGEVASSPPNAADPTGAKDLSFAILHSLYWFTVTLAGWRALRRSRKAPPICRSLPRSRGSKLTKRRQRRARGSPAEILSNDAEVAFVHPLVGAAVYEDMPALDRSLAHERAARLLRERGGRQICRGSTLRLPTRTSTRPGVRHIASRAQPASSAQTRSPRSRNRSRPTPPPGTSASRSSSVCTRRSPDPRQPWRNGDRGPALTALRSRL